MMTEPAQHGTPHISEEELQRRLEAWEAQLPGKPTIWDVVQHGDGRIAAAYITRTFCIAAQDAVRSHARVIELRRLTRLLFGADADRAERFLRAPTLLLNRTPLEATVESVNGMDEALRSLTLDFRHHAGIFLSSVANSWGLTVEEGAALLGAEEATFERWRSNPYMMPFAAIERAVTLHLTDRAMLRMLGDANAARYWLRAARKSSPFEKRRYPA